MRHATGTIRRGHNPKRPYRATAASRRYTTPRCRIGRPGAMAFAAPAWPQAALQRFEVLEPAPFPQRFGLDPLEAPKPPTARPRVVAAACALPAARLLGAETERSQQIALRAPDQIVAHARWARQPLFEREPPRKASRGSSPRHRNFLWPDVLSSSPPGLTRWSMLTGRVRCGPMSDLPSSMDRRVKPGDDELFRCRDAATHPSFAHAKKSQAKKHSQKTPPLKRREAERRQAHPPGAASKRDAARVLSPSPPCGRTEAQDFIEPWTSWSGRARLSAPHRGVRGFGLGSAWAALPGTTGCKREDPLRHQCSEHLAVRHVPDGTMPKPPASAMYRCARENRSRSALRSTLAKGVLRERDFG